MDIGFQEAGFEILLANDIDPVACSTYRLNHTSSIICGSVTDLDVDNIIPKKIDMVFGGPPCQGFSVAGKMDPDDSRSLLIQNFFDVVDKIQPKAFVCENVKALATLKRWDGIRDKLLKRSTYNYSVVLLVLNASDFGVPQNRERVFFVGVRKDVFLGGTELLESELKAHLNEQKSSPKSIGEIVRGLGKAGSVNNRRTCPAKITYAKAPIMRKSAYAGMLFNGAGRPMSSKGVASTLPASMGGNKTPIVDELEIFEGKQSFVEKYHKYLSEGGAPYTGIAPNRLRRLTIDECLAIQTFPANYKMAGSKSAIYRQIGNAVPVCLAKCVANSVARKIDEYWQDEIVTEDRLVAAAE